VRGSGCGETQRDCCGWGGRSPPRGRSPSANVAVCARPQRQPRTEVAPEAPRALSRGHQPPTEQDRRGGGAGKGAGLEGAGERGDDDELEVEGVLVLHDLDAQPLALVVPCRAPPRVRQGGRAARARAGGRGPLEESCAS